MYPFDQMLCARTQKAKSQCGCIDCVLLPRTKPRAVRNYASDPTVLYFIQGGEGGPIKIGFGDAPKARLSNLQCAHWVELTILATAPGSPQDEADLHRRFAHLHIRGEWHRPAQELLDYIATLTLPRFTTGD